MGSLFVKYDNLPGVLSKQELYKLFIQMKNGDLYAKEKIVLHNLKLVSVVLKRYYNCGVNLEELISVGNIGLMKAVNTFDISKNLEFSTYAAVCINNEILMYLRKDKWNLNVVSIHSVSKTFKDGNHVTYEDVLESDKDIVLEYEESVIYQIVLKIINNLSWQEHICIMMYYGLCGYEKTEQKEIAKKISVCQSQVSKILKRAITMIRKELINQSILEEKGFVKRA